MRSQIHDEVMSKGVDPDRRVFVQAYGNRLIDASNLMLPLIGFIDASDPVMKATIEISERELTSPEGYVYRYCGFDDGLAQNEGAFLICTFWLANNLVRLGETGCAQAIYERLLACVNDLGLLSEQIDPASGAMLGNFPQAFSHLGIINTARQLSLAIDNVWQPDEALGERVRNGVAPLCRQRGPAP